MDVFPAVAPPRRDGTMPGLTTRFSYEPYPLIGLRPVPAACTDLPDRPADKTASPRPAIWASAECPDRHGSRPVSPLTLDPPERAGWRTIIHPGSAWFGAPVMAQRGEQPSVCYSSAPSV
jgi:hypothetical protein